MSHKREGVRVKGVTDEQTSAIRSGPAHDVHDEGTSAEENGEHLAREEEYFEPEWRKATKV